MLVSCNSHFFLRIVRKSLNCEIKKKLQFLFFILWWKQAFIVFCIEEYNSMPVNISVEILSCICFVSECTEHGHQMLGSGPGGRWDPVYGSASRLGTHWYGWTWSESLSYICSSSQLSANQIATKGLKIISCGLLIVLFTGTIEPWGKHFLCVVCDWWFNWKGSWVISSLYWWTTTLVMLQMFFSCEQ